MSPPTLINRYRGYWYDEEDPVLSKLNRVQVGAWENTQAKVFNTMKKHGLDRMDWEDRYDTSEDEELTYEEGRDYSNSQLEALADKYLREYAKRELCRECLDEGLEEEGHDTGVVQPTPQFDKDGEPILDDTGQQLWLDYPEYMCTNGHKWFIGEGKSRGHAGTNPVLFEEHLIQRRKREIYTKEGVPDPEIVSGLYNRTHPQGRKVNTDKQRKSHGASFYR